MKKDIKEIKRVIDLLKEISGKYFIRIPALARELGVKQTDLWGFIKDNIVLFHVTTNNDGEKVVGNVWLAEEDRPMTKAWLDANPDYVKHWNAIGSELIYDEETKVYSIRVK